MLLIRLLLLGISVLGLDPGESRASAAAEGREGSARKPTRTGPASGAAPDSEVPPVGAGMNGRPPSGASPVTSASLPPTPGAALALQKISDTQGYLSAPGSPGTNPGGLLDDIDLFGPSAKAGDLDGNGRMEFWVSARQDDDGGFNRGAGYVLSLNLDGTVASLQKVSDTAGGLSGPGNPGGVLADLATFGSPVARLDDLDGDGVDDLAVGVFTDDGGGSDRGAVFVLRMNANGTVKALTVIDDSSMGGALADGDSFGRGVAWLGDLGGAGAMSSVLAVGTTGDDDGGADRGAVYLLSLYSDGTLASYRKISQTQGGFPGVLADGDSLGRSVERLGDLDDDGLLEVAVGTIDGGGGTGSVWILSLAANGTVASALEIASLQNGFTGVLDAADRFGFHLASLGDLNGDGVEDLAVGAFRDDDGGTDRGAVWLLFLDTDGSVLSSSKLSAADPLLSAELDDGDNFGSVAAADIDGNGVTDLLVGAISDDDGGNARGAAYVLFLDGTAAVCGNGVLDPAEACDDGNTSNLDLCSSTCTLLGPVCGDSVIEGPETCDDGNTTPNDGCSPQCKAESELGVSGTAQGGQVTVWLYDQLTVVVNTTPGMTAAQVAQAIADQANSLWFGIAAISGAQIYFLLAVTNAVSTDAGLSFAFVPPVPIGVRLYQASWIAEVRGNDDTTGPLPESQRFEVRALPLGRMCNPGHPPCPYSKTGARVPGPTPLTPKQWDPLAAYCVPNSAFGLGPTRPAQGATPMTFLGNGIFRPIPPLYRNPSFFQPGGAPRTTACSAAETVLGGQATATVLTTNDPLRGPVMRGAPLTGGGIAATTGVASPRAFSFPAAAASPSGSGFRRTTVGSLSQDPPLAYQQTEAQLRNGPGSFQVGGGFFPPGGSVSTRSFPVMRAGGTAANVTVKAGTNRFGGVMRLLGYVATQVCAYRNGGCWLGAQNRRYEAIGAAAYTSGGSVTAPMLESYTAKYYHTNLMQESTVQIFGHRFPWTTGTVTVTASGVDGGHETIQRRHGYDNRVNGVGTIQLVSPFVTRSVQPASDYETAGIAILRLVFVPEPEAWLMLAAGGALLGGLYRWRPR